MDEIGTVTIERIHDPSRWPCDLIRIAAVAPRVRISRELIDSACRGAVADRSPYLHLDGDVLTIRDDYGQRFIYRIHWDDYRDGGYLAEWPD